MYKEEPKLLILGSSDSGKSTLLKQLKILHGGGFGQNEKNSSKRAIQTSLIDCIVGLIYSDEKESSEMGNRAQQKYIPLADFHAAWFSGESEITPEAREMLISAWTDSWVREQFDKQAANYPDTIMHQFVPSNEDILNLRTVTQSVSDTIFTVQKKNVHFIDVSGLKHHRSSWLSYFDDVHSILFVVSLSGYNQNMAEDASVNRMADSLVLFEQMANHTMLKKKDFVLFLNKRDLFEKKIKKIPLSQYFPDYTGRSAAADLPAGKEGSVSQGIKYIEKKFRSQIAEGRYMLSHITCCTDTKSMSVIINSLL
ncbi:hypothetical protein HDU91_001791 [Kappamyces sp. JEL0680]|nr:hypothetical protein HDU91_001791 [Kappamyces sp. JEL0680]